MRPKYYYLTIAFLFILFAVMTSAPGSMAAPALQAGTATSAPTVAATSVATLIASPGASVAATNVTTPASTGSTTPGPVPTVIPPTPAPLLAVPQASTNDPTGLILLALVIALALLAATIVTLRR